MSCGIRQLTSDEARGFWREQADARIFLHPDVLEPMCERVDWWLASWNGRPVCLWPMCRAFDGSHRPPALSAYVGPLWHDEVARNKAHRWWSITRDTQQALLALFVERYRDFVFELPPGTCDIRVLQWLQGAGEGEWKIDIACRHTALLELPAGGDDDALLRLFSRNRVKDIRRSRRTEALREWTNPDADALCALYAGLLERKDESGLARDRQREVRELIRLAASGFGQVIAYRDETGTQASFILSLDSGKTASLVLAASTAEAAECGLQAFVQHELLARSGAQGRETVDFLGANSKPGAEEKHRYGGWPALYFRILVAQR